MSETITIKLPYPPKELSPNGGKRWFFHKVNRLKNDYKLIAKIAANYAKPRGHKPWEKAETQITYFRSKRGPAMDQDNCLAWLKSGLDGITAAGIVKDDSGLVHKPVQFGVDKEDPHVVIEITPLI